MLLSTGTRPFEVAWFSLILGIIFFIIGIIFYYPYYKGKPKPQSGIKRANIFEYMNDSLKILSYHRSMGLVVMGLFFIIVSIIFFTIGLCK